MSNNNKGWMIIRAPRLRGKRDSKWHYFDENQSLCHRSRYHPRLHGALTDSVEPIDYWLRCGECMEILGERDIEDQKIEE